MLNTTDCYYFELVLLNHSCVFICNYIHNVSTYFKILCKTNHIILTMQNEKSFYWFWILLVLLILFAYLKTCEMIHWMELWCRLFWNFVGILENSKFIQLFQSVWQPGSWVLVPKFSLPIRLSDSFTQHISRMVWLFDFIFYMTVQYCNWSQRDKFWLLIGFGILLECVLKSCLLTKLSITYLLTDNLFFSNIIV